jgi:hypothetical protein
MGFHQMLTLFFIPGSDRYGFHKKRAGARYAKLLFLHPVQSTGHVVHSGASRVWYLDALFFMLWWARCGFCKKCVGTRYAKLVFLHPV